MAIEALTNASKYSTSQCKLTPTPTKIGASAAPEAAHAARIKVVEDAKAATSDAAALISLLKITPSP